MYDPTQDESALLSGGGSKLSRDVAKPTLIEWAVACGMDIHSHLHHLVSHLILK